MLVFEERRLPVAGRRSGEATYVWLEPRYELLSDWLRPRLADTDERASLAREGELRLLRRRGPSPNQNLRFARRFPPFVPFFVPTGGVFELHGRG